MTQDLIKRLEGLEGPCLETNARIWCALNGKRYKEHWQSYTGALRVAFTEPPKRTQLASGEDVLNYTASLDAAMTLVPEGWRIAKIEQHWRTGQWNAWLVKRPTDGQATAFDNGKAIGLADAASDAPTPAIALCICALRARKGHIEAQGGERG